MQKFSRLYIIIVAGFLLKYFIIMPSLEYFLEVLKLWLITKKYIGILKPIDMTLSLILKVLKKKSQNFDKIFQFIWSLLFKNDKSTGRFHQIFVTFLQKLNTYYHIKTISLIKLNWFEKYRLLLQCVFKSNNIQNTG